MHAGIHTPLGMGLETPPGQTPKLLPWVWSWRPPRPDPSTSPLGDRPGNLQGMLGYHPLETCCKACWDTTCNACWDTISPVNRMTDRCKNITLPQTSFADGNKVIIFQISLNQACNDGSNEPRTSEPTIPL